MSQHPSLKANTMQRHRSVLKHLERIKILKEKGEWKEGYSFFGLPKIKTQKIKVKKEKVEKPEEEKTTAQRPTGEITEGKEEVKTKVVKTKPGEKGKK